MPNIFESNYSAEYPPAQVCGGSAKLHVGYTRAEQHTARDGDQGNEPLRERSRDQLRLAAWGQACEKAVEEVVDEYIVATIVLIQCEHEMAPIEHRLNIICFMTEPGRKLFAYDSVCRDPVAWGAIKRHKRNHFAGAKVTMTLS